MIVVIPQSGYHENDRGISGELREAMDGEITKSERIQSVGVVRSKAAKAPTLWSCVIGTQTSRLNFVSVNVRRLWLEEVLPPRSISWDGLQMQNIWA